MLSHMHPQLAAFFQYRVEQQKLLEQLDGPGAVMPMPDLKGLRAWYKMFGQRVGGVGSGGGRGTRFRGRNR